MSLWNSIERTVICILVTHMTLQLTSAACIVQQIVLDMEYATGLNQSLCANALTHLTQLQGVTSHLATPGHRLSSLQPLQIECSFWISELDVVE